MHENDKIQGIKPGFDEVVRFRACQVIPGFQYVETRLDARIARGSSGVLLPRKIGENGKLTLQPHFFGLMAHDFARTAHSVRTRRNVRDHRTYTSRLIQTLSTT